MPGCGNDIGDHQKAETKPSCRLISERFSIPEVVSRAKALRLQSGCAVAKIDDISRLKQGNHAISIIQVCLVGDLENILPIVRSINNLLSFFQYFRNGLRIELSKSHIEC